MNIVQLSTFRLFYKIIHNSGYGLLHSGTSFLQILKHEASTFSNDDGIPGTIAPGTGT